DLERAAAEADAAPAAGPGRAAELARLFAAHRAQLRDAGLVEFEGRLPHAARLLEEDRRQPFDRVRAAFVDGFAGFTRAQMRLLAALAGGVAEVRVALPDEPSGGRDELFSRPRAAGELLQHTLRPVAVDVSYVGAMPAGEGTRPAGLVHVERQLFLPVRDVDPSPDADGVQLVEAPGLLGETRIVAGRAKR